MKRLTKEEFIRRAKLIHGDTYDYSLSEYKNMDKNIIIICPKHGKFEQTPNHHINRGDKCPNCSKNKQLSPEEQIKRFVSIYGDKYKYDLNNIKNANTNIDIFCNTCKKYFKQTPYRHYYRKLGCPNCSKTKTLTKEEFIERAINVHGNKYDYSKTVYINIDTNIDIFCNTCKRYFKQTPYNHIKGRGCKKCKFTSGEGKIADFLENNNIVYEYWKDFENLKDERKLSYDFYIPSKNLLIEFNGEQHYIKKNLQETYMSGINNCIMIG